MDVAWWEKEIVEQPFQLYSDSGGEWKEKDLVEVIWKTRKDLYRNSYGRNYIVSRSAHVEAKWNSYIK